ncbi:MAG: hypothetical protein LC785_09590, partial [Acidobacteria bacterium]|nr:hypothetical protein [Acidobacteriota bacterium]
MSESVKGTTAKPIEEKDKQRLTDYLMERVLKGISGRDGGDLVDVEPIRTIFSGVLQPPRNTAIQAAKSGAVDSATPTSAALGLDFRIKPKNAEGVIRLHLSPRWSHYYAVFPTWQQALRANEASLSTTASPSPTVTSAQTGSDSPSIEPTETNEGTSENTVDDADELENEAQPPQTGRVILPKVFRRYEVAPKTITYEFDPKHLESVQLGLEELAISIREARSVMAADKDAWHYLGDPEKRDRSLGDASVIGSAEAYEKTLEAMKGEAVPLPPWAVSLQVDINPDPIEPEVLRVRVLLSNRTPERDETVADPKLEERTLFDAGLI